MSWIDNDRLENERIARELVKRLEDGETVDAKVLSAAIEALISNNLARAKAMRHWRMDMLSLLNDVAKWKRRFELLRREIARAAQPETWEYK